MSGLVVFGLQTVYFWQQESLCMVYLCDQSQDSFVITVSAEGKTVCPWPPCCSFTFYSFITQTKL